MANGINAKRTQGKEWWGKRPLSCTSTSTKRGNKFWKRLLHKIERRINKKAVSNEND